jgi:hypothetical protein
MLDRRRFLFASLGAPVAALAGLQNERWLARWIAVPGADPQAYGVYLFRRNFELSAKPSRFVVHVTGDNRYQLFVNGQRSVWGPARGDLHHWRYETVDIADKLRPGRNTVAALVWNEGPHIALAQISNRTGFLLQGDGTAEQVVNTGPDWLCHHDKAYQPLPISPEDRVEYWALGPGDQVDGALHPWGWEQPGFNDSKWSKPIVLSQGSPRYANDGPNAWMLVPRPIPLMAEEPEALEEAREGSGFQRSPDGKWTVRAGTSARLLLDNGVLTTAFPEITVSGGRGARIAIKTIEGPRGPKKYGPKPHRDKIEGALMLGPQDRWTTDGGTARLLRPLFWRTFRYLELEVEAQAEPLHIDSIRSVYTGYPFQRVARFEGGWPDLQQILDIGWRTARLCAHETYVDCPFYEQLQYVGDTRIQALVSIYNSGDHRLMRNAIEQIDSSRTAEGATYSRAPSALQQYIPPFCLWWIGMVHDYWWYVDEPKFVQAMLPGVRAVLTFFSSYQESNGQLRPMPWWNYVDWVPTGVWPSSSGPPNGDRMSAIHEMQLLLAYQWAAELEDALGNPALAAQFAKAASDLKAKLRRDYWNAGRGLFQDTVDGKYYSQHGNSLAVLAGLTEGAEARSVMEKTLADSSLAPASIYFTYYVRLAMRKAGLGDRYLNLLDRPWRWAMSYGFTTWPETDRESTRSDCHAWGSSPNIEFFRTVLGIDSAAPGFSRVLVQPHLGPLKKASGLVPHARGPIQVEYAVTDTGALDAVISLPAPLTGELEWRGQRHALASGDNRIKA